jgi:hypothetical protein
MRVLERFVRCRLLMTTRSNWWKRPMTMTTIGAAWLCLGCAADTSDLRDERDRTDLAALACELEDVTVEIAGSAPWKDCGDLAISDSDVEIQLARECAESALAHEEPFRVLWHSQGVDSAVAGAVLGIRSGSEYQVSTFSYDSAGVAPDGASAIYRRCSGVSFVACELQGVSARLCTQCAPQPQAQECRCKVARRTGLSATAAVADVVTECR